MQRQCAEEREWSKISYLGLFRSGGTSSLLSPPFIATVVWMTALQNCKRSSTIEASKSETNETWANWNRAPQAKRDHLIWEHPWTRRWMHPAELLSSDPKQMEDVNVKMRAFRKWRHQLLQHVLCNPGPLVCFFFSFIIAIVFFIRTVRSDWLILKINLFLAILALKCIPGLFLVPPSCSFGSC